MNNKYILLFGLSMLFSACSDAPGLTLTAASFTEEQLPSCQQRTCPSITVNYIVVGGETEVADSINAAIAEFVSTSLMGNEETGNRPHSDLKAAAVDFAQLYFNDKAEFPDMAGTYEANVTVRESYVSEEILSVEMKQYTYTGGAHGYGSTQFKNFDVRTGEKLESSDIVSDPDGFLALAEQMFREKFGISSNQNINATGFWFENDTYHLPKTIGLSSQGIILHYNPYDIASYAEGAIELTIPWEKTKPFVNINLP